MLHLAFLGLLCMAASHNTEASSYVEARKAMEAQLKEAESLQLKLEAVRLHSLERWRHWQERVEANQQGLVHKQQGLAHLDEACRQHHLGLCRLGAHGVAALQAGRLVGEWAVATRKLRGLLQQCAQQQRQLLEERGQLLREERRLKRLEKSLEQTQVDLEEMEYKLHLHRAALTDALTALPDVPQADEAPTPSPGVKGWLSPPLFGVIERHFGPDINPKSNTTTLHKGILIRAAPGSRVRAVAPGRVAFVGQLKGFGGLVILAHEGGWHSLAAHLQEIFVAENEALPQGAWLGTVGEAKSTEGAGALLYFEIRQQGEAQNPQEWFLVSSFR